MSGDERTELRRLELAAAAAAPSIPEGAHVSAEVLAKMRAGDESPSLDEAYRHIAACGACRGALAAPERAAEAEREATREHAEALGEPRRRTRRAVPAWGVALAAAAAVALAVGASRLGAHDEPVAIAQRPVAGWMGERPAGGNVAPADANLELRVEASQFAAAVLVTCDDHGRAIAPAAPFARDAKGGLTIVVAPRTFAKHEGKALGLVVLGGEDAVRGVESSEEARAGAASVQALVDALRARAGRGAHVERVVLGE